MRHFLCDRKLTTNTQKPRAGGGGNEKRKDEEMQMFDGSKEFLEVRERSLLNISVLGISKI